MHFEKQYVQFKSEWVYEGRVYGLGVSRRTGRATVTSNLRRLVLKVLDIDL